MATTIRTALLATALATLHAILPARAQAPAAPTLDRTVLPIAPAPFGGQIGRTWQDSRQDFPQPIRPPQGAPNVLVIMLDDTGFGHTSAFGGPVPTPNLDALRRQGVSFNRFHTTGICSPTRAALLTGRNHHQVATGTIMELSTGFPGYDTLWPRATASIAEVLRQNGYTTAAFGKWHNTPDWQTSPQGPFDQWPTGMGFQYWYGFQGGETSQWEPQLFRNTTPIEAPGRPENGYHLDRDLADEAMGWLSRQGSLTPDQPFFVYYAPGAAHAPLHAPREWADRFRGQFDMGWDRMREETLARQKQLGVVPQDTVLTPRPDAIPSWESMPAADRPVYARQMENMAGFLAHTDFQIGRLLEAVRARPDADNTLIMFIVGDNGPSAEGTMTGTLNNVMTQNGIADTVDRQRQDLDNWGSWHHEPHVAVPWAWALAAPFQWMKRVPSHFGGIRNPLVVVWPSRIREHGTVRGQFHHVIDVAPTILEAAGLPVPVRVNGVDQSEMAGVSMLYALADANAQGRRTTQYFETGGHRGIYHEGWFASAFLGVPWELTGSSPRLNEPRRELYDLSRDFSQARDLAAQHPDRVRELAPIFDREAQRYNVFPLDDRFVERARNDERPSVTRGRTQFRFGPEVRRVPEGSAPPTYQRSHTITVRAEMSQAGAEGVLFAIGGSSGGYTLFVREGRVHYEYNFFGRTRTTLTGSTPLPAGGGPVEIRFDYDQDADKANARGGEARLSVNGAAAGRIAVPQVVPSRFSATETMDIGADLGSPVSETYRAQAPFAFTGRIREVAVELR